MTLSENIQLDRVLYFESLPFDALVAVSQLCSIGCIVVFDQNHCKVLKGDQHLFTGYTEGGNLYRARRPHVLSISSSTKDKILREHERLAHMKGDSLALWTGTTLHQVTEALKDTACRGCQS